MGFLLWVTAPLRREVPALARTARPRHAVRGTAGTRSGSGGHRHRGVQREGGLRQQRRRPRGNGSCRQEE